MNGIHLELLSHRHIVTDQNNTSDIFVKQNWHIAAFTKPMHCKLQWNIYFYNSVGNLKVTDVNIKNVTHKILVDVHYKNWKHTTAIQYKSRGPTCVVIQNFLRVPTWRLSLNWKQSTLARYRADSTIYLHSVFQWNCRRRWPQLKRRNYLLFRTVQLNDSRSAAHLSLLPELGLSLSSIFKYIQTESNKFRELLCLESMRGLVTDRLIWSLELLLSQRVTHHRSLNF